MGAQWGKNFHVCTVPLGICLLTHCWERSEEEMLGDKRQMSEGHITFSNTCVTQTQLVSSKFCVIYQGSSSVHLQNKTFALNYKILICHFIFTFSKYIGDWLFHSPNNFLCPLIILGMDTLAPVCVHMWVFIQLSLAASLIKTVCQVNHSKLRLMLFFILM